MLFNLDAKEKPILRKASVHGLGHLIEPYKDEDAPPDLPKPQVPVNEMGVRRWQHDFWVRIIEAELAGHSNRVGLDWHPSLSRPAAQRFSASSPHLLAWLDRCNDGRAYEDQIRPFGFLLVFTAKTGVFVDSPDLESSVIRDAQRGRPPKRNEARPIAPFSSDPAQALPNVIDRVTGEFIGRDTLKTYAEVLCQYHLSSESKFENGDFLDRGKTVRRHVAATAVTLIGKEANKVGLSGEQDPIASPVEPLALVETQ